jgi:WD40 repeat protein
MIAGSKVADLGKCEQFKKMTATFSPDGRLFALADGTVIRRWRLDDATKPLLLEVPGEKVILLKFSADGKSLASVAVLKEGGAKVRVWNSESGQLVQAFTLPVDPSARWFLSFAPDGRRLNLTSTIDKELTVWDTATGKAKFTFKDAGDAVAFSPDGTRLVTLGKSQTPILWDCTTGKKLATSRVLSADGEDGVRVSTGNAAISRDGKRIVLARTVWAGDFVGDVKLCDAATGAEIPLQGFEQEKFFAATPSPDGKRLAAGGRDGIIKIWDAGNGRELHTLHGHTAQVFAVAFSPDGKQLASASADQTIKLWDGDAGREVRTLRGHTWPIEAIVFSPDGRRLASATGGFDLFSPMVSKVWDVDLDQEVRVIRRDPAAEVALSFSSNGLILASAKRDKDKTVRLREAGTGKELRTFTCQSDSIRGLTFSPDGKAVAAAGWKDGGKDGLIQVWDVTGGKERFVIGDLHFIHSMAFSSDGSRLLAVQDEGDRRTHVVKSWDAATGREMPAAQLADGWMGANAFSPDGTRFAAIMREVHSDTERLRVWDLTTGQEFPAFRAVRVDYWITSLFFSPDGTRLISAGHDGREKNTATLWDAATGEKIRTFRRSLPGSAARPAISPDGLRLATGGGNEVMGEVTLWEAATGDETLTLRGIPKDVYSLAFSPDGHRLAAMCADGTIRVWDGTPVENAAR